MEKCNDGEGFMSKGKCIPYRNDRQKEGYKDAEVSEAKTNSKVINKYIAEKKPTLKLEKITLPKKGTIVLKKKSTVMIPKGKNPDLIA